MKILKYTVQALGVVLIVAFVFWKIARQPTFQFFGNLLYRVNTTDKIVALTFDDGPGPNNTEEVLSILKENSIPATFFMIGQNIEAQPELAKKVLAAGHQIANHSYSHKRMLLYGVDFCKNEILKTDQIIRSIGYKDEIVFRPPFGKKLFTLPLALKELGKLAVTWDAESNDTETQDARVLETNVMSNIKPGSIILFHDGFARKEGTLTALREVVKELKSEGYSFATVNELRKHAINN